MTKRWQGSKWIRPERRRAIYERDGYQCHWCHLQMACYLLGRWSNFSKCLTLDHKRPRSKGGDNSNRNLVTSCKACNSSRQAKSRPKVKPENRALSYGVLHPGCQPASRPKEKSVDIVASKHHTRRTGRKSPRARSGPLASSTGRTYIKQDRKGLLVMFVSKPATAIPEGWQERQA